jgi:hypothetical protein
VSFNAAVVLGKRALAQCIQIRERTVAMLEQNDRIMDSIRPRAKIAPFYALNEPDQTEQKQG